MNNVSNASHPDGRDQDTASISNTVNGSLSEALGDGAQDAGAALSEVQSQLHGTAAAVGERMSKTGARLGAQLTAARQSIDNAATAVGDRARVAATAGNGYIHEHPWQAIGISSAAGFLIGVLLARRR